MDIFCLWCEQWVTLQQFGRFRRTHSTGGRCKRCALARRSMSRAANMGWVDDVLHYVENYSQNYVFQEILEFGAGEPDGFAKADIAYQNFAISADELEQTSRRELGDTPPVNHPDRVRSVRIRIMRDRYEKSLDLWTGEKIDNERKDLEKIGYYTSRKNGQKQRIENQ